MLSIALPCERLVPKRHRLGASMISVVKLKNETWTFKYQEWFWGLIAIFLMTGFSYFYVGRLPWQSDLLYVENIYSDLFIKHISLSGWLFARAASFFPDCVVYFLLRAITPHLNVTLFLYILLTCCVIWWWTVRQSGKHIVFFGWMITYFGLFMPNWHYFWVTDMHGGAWCMGMIFSVLFLDLKNTKTWIFWVLVLIGGASAQSDLFFGVQTLVPLGITSLYFFWRKRITTRQLMTRIKIGVGCIIVMILVSELVYTLTGADRTDFLWNRANFYLQFSSIFNYLLDQSWKTLVIFLGIGVLIRKARSSEQSAFLVMAITCNMIAVVLSCLWYNAEAVRYLAPVGFGSAWAIADFIFVEGSRTAVLKILKFALALVLAFSAAKNFKENYLDHYVISPFEDPYPEQQRCIDEQVTSHGYTHGFGKYWLSRMPTLLSKKNIMVVQVSDNLSVDHYSNNRNWYSEPELFHFVLRQVDTNSQDRDNIIKKWGSESFREFCGNVEILYYNQVIKTHR